MKRRMLIALFAGLFLKMEKAGASFVKPTYRLIAQSEKPKKKFGNDLPIKITPAKKDAGDIMAVMISGDGGWTGFDQDIATALADKNVPVVGLNALKYFWKMKSPLQTTHDVMELIEHYLATWHKRRVILVGYSFGADVLPFVYNRLVPALKEKVVSIGLLSPSRNTDFEVHVSDLFSLGGDDRSYAVIPEIERIRHEKVFCFYGKDEDDFPVAQIPKKVCKVVALEGGHHYENASATIAGMLIL